VTITQPDSRTVRVHTQGAVLSFPYRFHWNGHERLPESVVREENEVKAFFLFGMVKDVFSEDADGLRVRRTWSVMTPGPVRLETRLDLDMPGASFLFPGALSGSGVPDHPRSILGERTSLPSGVFLFHPDGGALIFTELPAGEEEASSIGVRREAGEDGDLTVVEVKIPPREEPASLIGPRPRDTEVTEALEVASPGSLERSLTVRVVFAARDRIVLRGTGAALRCLGSRTVAPAGEPGEAAALSACLTTHLHQEGGVCGLRDVPGSGWLSSSAGAAMAELLLRLRPADPALRETALRLADFCLKGQHPTGFFFESYHVESRKWQGVRGKRGDVPLLSLSHSAVIADSLLQLSRTLSELGMPGEKYWIAGARFVDFFVDPKGKVALPGALHAPGEAEPAERSVSGFELLFPLARMLAVTGKDRLAKAVDTLFREFAAVGWDAASPPASREGREPDSGAALLAGRVAALGLGMGREVGEPEAFLCLLAPWVHANRPAGRPREPLGGIGDSFRRQRLLYAGAEAAWVLRCLAAQCEDREARKTAEGLAAMALSFSGSAPLGTAFLHHTRWDPAGKPQEAGLGARGPVDARRLTREVSFRLLLREGVPAPARKKKTAVKHKAAAKKPAAAKSKKALKPKKAAGKKPVTRKGKKRLPRPGPGPR
jgi:hypothetical protein